MSKASYQATSLYFTVDCPSNKRSYGTRSVAKRAAKELAKKGHGNMRPYICYHCDQYHICHPLVKNGVR
jgi:hypothetical protein